MSMLLRIVVITLGLVVAGFLAGGAVGMVMMVVWEIGDGGGLLLPSRDALFLGGTIGGMLGAVLGPWAAWVLMRHIPLWLAIGGTAAGTVVGGVLGFMAGHIIGALYAGVLFFFLSAGILRLIEPAG